MKVKTICGILAGFMLICTLASLPTLSKAAEETPEATSESGTAETAPTQETTESEPGEYQDLKASAQYVDLLKSWEGFSGTPYWDYSHWSIGYGCTCPDDKVEYYRENPMSKEEAEALLREELDGFENSVNTLARKNNLKFTQNEFDALVSFSYNCGNKWSREKNGNLYNAVVSGDKGPRFIYSMCLWSRAGSEYILIGRRMRETQIFMNGVYSTEYPDNYRYVFLDAAGGTVRYIIHGFDTEKPTEVLTPIQSYPDGPDENGHRVTYQFDGWYTQRVGGEKVEQLDGKLEAGTVLYAHWKTPSGKPVVIPEPDDGVSMKVTVTGKTLNVRSGPQTYYATLYQAKKGDQFTITEVVRGGRYFWGKSDKGWICLKYTDYDEQIDKLFPAQGTINADAVNVRNGPGTSYDRLAGRNLGDRVEITEWKSDGSMMWGKTAEGWINMKYITLDDENGPAKLVMDVQLDSKPNKLQYVQMNENLDLTGGKIKVSYTTGASEIIPITQDMVSGFDNSKVGPRTITVKYGKKSLTFDVEIIKATVIFKNYDGKVLSTDSYLYGEKVKIPDVPAKPSDKDGIYAFDGWDKEVTECKGNATYTAKFKLAYPTGDFDKDGQVTDRDVIYLKWHIVFPDRYPIDGKADFNKDGEITDRDAIYLKWHIVFPDKYPLN